MKSAVDENIDALSEAILSDARAEAEKTRVEAQARAEEIRRRAQEQAQQARKEILERAEQEAQRIRGQVIATTQMKARTSQLDHREGLLNKVFAEAQRELTHIQQWTDYGDIARALLVEALTQLRSPSVTVRADANTLKVLTPRVLEELGKERGMEIKAGAALEKGTGVIVESADGHLQYDNTLETRLQRMQNSLRSMVYHIMMGEAQ